jgi:hypothetical protein
VVHRLHQEAEQVNALARLQDVGCLHHLDLSAVLDDEAREERVPAQRSRAMREGSEKSEDGKREREQRRE